MPAINTSVQKACRLLKALSDERNARLVDLAQATGIDKASALRLLETLVAEGMVQRDARSKRFSLGREWLVARAAAAQRMDARHLARPALIRLAHRFEDSVIFSELSGWESVCTELRFGTFPIRANYLSIGSRRPLGVGAGSLALLAALPDAEVEAVMLSIAPRLQRYPRISVDFLCQQVECTRRRGYALLLDVVVEHMGGIAIAVPDANGDLLGAISIAALSERLIERRDAIVVELRKEAAMITQRWHEQSELSRRPFDLPHAVLP
ncbi:IclR family transcriptional regulator [Vandammella animalimorsus]|uniref:IclR family transcriptional regulator n=1 Tax=Vandammella animalimorsus TaxID=2029117 RepID=A0A2A2AA19_9BURK|nr:helix-turn-helix domain-containing protein [Vandammella animalimorsus]PAT35380.1 IclR family transcriptional regulator [Vandammella animalimorsus]